MIKTIDNTLDIGVIEDVPQGLQNLIANLESKFKCNGIC